MTIKLQVMGKQSRDLHDMILDLPTMQQYHFLMKIIFLEHNLSLKRYCLRNIQQYSAISGEACFKNFNFSYENIEFIRDCLPGSMNCYVFLLGIWRQTGAAKSSQFIKYFFTRNQFLAPVSWWKYIFIIFYEKLKDVLPLNLVELLFGLNHKRAKYEQKSSFQGSIVTYNQKTRKNC